MSTSDQRILAFLRHKASEQGLEILTKAIDAGKVTVPQAQSYLSQYRERENAIRRIDHLRKGLNNAMDYFTMWSNILDFEFEVSDADYEWILDKVRNLEAKFPEYIANVVATERLIEEPLLPTWEDEK